MVDEPVNLSGNIGVNNTGTAIAAAKQLLMDCEGDGCTTLYKEHLRFILMEFIELWKNNQTRISTAYKKVAG